MSEQLSIQWFPGHMTKARRQIAEDIRLVDGVCQVIDARIPLSSQNPDLPELIGEKPMLTILNRSDQADPEYTKQWKAELSKLGGVIETDCKSGKGVGAFRQAVMRLLSDKLEQYARKGQTGRKLRIMVVGIPNVGKSSLINRISGRKAAAAADRPGVTKGRQWIILDKGLELLDTPGILWPKFESQTVGEHLAFTGAIKDDILDRETLSANLMSELAGLYPDRLEQRYRLVVSSDQTGFELLEQAARRRGFLVSGGEPDLERMANVLLDEFRGGMLGRITLERAQ